MTPFYKNTFNRLPYDGEVYYLPSKVFALECVDNPFQLLFQNIQWQTEQLTIFGRTTITQRKSAFYGELGITYTYSGLEKTALPWTDTLLTIKHAVEEITKTQFNACLLNLYHTGEEGMGWHRDNEKSLRKQSIIASVSFGAQRTFYFRHRITKEKICIELEDKSLLIMAGDTQSHWEHTLPVRKKITQPRINLTFRQINEKNP